MSVDCYISKVELIHRRSSEPGTPGGYTASMLEGTPMTRCRCGERRHPMRSPLSRWNANFGEGREKKTAQNAFWGFPKSYGLHPLKQVMLLTGIGKLLQKASLLSDPRREKRKKM